MDDYADGMRLMNTLSYEVHVTRHYKQDEDYALSMHAHMLCNLRVSVFVSLYLLWMWFVSCLSSVLVLLFRLYVLDTVGDGSQDSSMPSMARTTTDELRAVVSNPSKSVVSDLGSSVSQRVQAVNSSPVHVVWWSTAAVDVDEDWPEEWCYHWEDDWHEDWSWHNPEEHMSERHNDQSSYLVCGVAGSNPNLKQQNSEKVKLMINSGSQRTVCTQRKTTRQTISRGRWCGGQNE